MQDISLHILDLTQNSISADATEITILIDERPSKDWLTVSIRDNGKGMPPEMVERVTDPFVTTRTTRKVGLGLPLFKQNAIQSGGDMTITSEQGVGTYLEATFGYSNIDRLPLGDIANTVMMLVSSNPLIRFIFEYKYESEQYTFDTIEINEALDGMPINTPPIIKYLMEMIRENMESAKNLKN